MLDAVVREGSVEVMNVNLFSWSQWHCQWHLQWPAIFISRSAPICRSCTTLPGHIEILVVTCMASSFLYVSIFLPSLLFSQYIFPSRLDQKRLRLLISLYTCLGTASHNFENSVSRSLQAMNFLCWPRSFYSLSSVRRISLRCTAHDRYKRPYIPV